MTLSFKGTVAAVALLAFAATAPAAQAQSDYPNRNLTMICGFAAGSGLDVYARWYADRMGKVIGKTILVENKVGANSLIASEYVTKQRPDGYTIYMTGTGALAPIIHLWTKPPIDGVSDMEYITTINRQTFFVTVDARSNIHSIADLTKLWREKAGKGSYATTAINGVVLGALYKNIAKLDVTDVPYRTMEPAFNELLDGRLDAIMADPVGALAQISTGKLRGLAVASAKRMDSAPQFPTMAEAGVPGIDLTSHLLFTGPKGLPKPVVDRLHAVIKEVTMTAEAKEFLNRFGADPFIMSPQELTEKMKAEQKAWGEYIKLANIPKAG